MPYPDWTHGVHHDGSAQYVSHVIPEIGTSVEIRLRVPLEANLNAVYLRTAPDGEQHFERMAHSHDDAVSAWYTATLPMQNPRMTYRFRLMTDMGAFIYNAAGIRRAVVPDHNDFKLVAGFEHPAWLDRTVFYQIFPERFHNGDPTLNPKAGEPYHHPPYEPFATQQRAWDEAPLPFHEGGNVDFFGGDIPGIIEKLDYLQALGINALYLNPIFDSGSNHKYNARDFDNVDPAFGGNDALVALREALDAADMRYILDLTPNHTGDDHVWFTAAQADPHAPTAEFYTFYNHPDEYENWLGVKTLPELNYTSQPLRDRMYRTPQSVMQKWLLPPFRADGWRLDVWNMTARQAQVDVQREVGREMREAVKTTRSDAYLFGEHFFDASDTLQGDEMDAVMNYQGFSFPMWRWLSGHDLGAWNEEPKPYTDTVPLPAEDMAEQMTQFMAAVPWVVARIQFNLLGSHDTPRILNVCNGDTALVKVATALLLTFPGVPSIYYGDEISMEGGRDPDNRRPMIWDETQQDTDMLDYHRQLIALRRQNDALVAGGFQFLLADGDVLAYQRATANAHLIFVGYRGAGANESIQVPVRHGGVSDGTTFTDVIHGVTYTVTDGNLSLDRVSGPIAFVLTMDDA